jgi:hypothetical protein
MEQLSLTMGVIIKLLVLNLKIIAFNLSSPNLFDLVLEQKR